LLQIRVHRAHAIENWRARIGPALPGWLEAVGEFEALVALAGYAHEHPDDVFPEIVTAPCLHASGLGHPLLPASACVRNDVALDPEHALLLISGSNMSGKSTLLRAVGLAVVLGQAGAPVRAQALRFSPMPLGTCISIHDSLREGSSRFWAEITRLRAIDMATAGGRPLLFLLDELLSGTNSHDRLLGARAVLRQLLAHGAIGMVTTHDLALAQLADELSPRASNAHFEDGVRDGKMVFDYRMRPGVVERGNALALMRLLGLLGEAAPPA
jgi:DNA mismatch repair ATPase MutS